MRFKRHQGCLPSGTRPSLCSWLNMASILKPLQQLVATIPPHPVHYLLVEENISSKEPCEPRVELTVPSDTFIPQGSQDPLLPARGYRIKEGGTPSNPRICKHWLGDEPISHWYFLKWMWLGCFRILTQFPRTTKSEENFGSLTCPFRVIDKKHVEMYAMCVMVDWTLHNEWSSPRVSWGCRRY